VDDLFPGIHPYLNSYFQAGHWESFHALHIGHLHDALEMVLPEGYGSLPEESLQISRIIYPETMPLPPVTLKPDVTVFQKSSSGQAAATLPTPPTDTLALTELQEEVETLTALVIYEIVGQELPGKPVTRIELLSPANKPGGSYHTTYVSKRLESLKGGLNLVEIDYLHETRPILPALPSYPQHQAGAYPYRVIVSDPHPTYTQGIARVYGFGVDEPIPRIAVPLAEDDTVTFDLGIPYQRTRDGARIFRQIADSTKLPINFDRYSETDQQRIRELIAKR
jgi:hypothetical protein